MEDEFFLGRRCVSGDDGRLTWLVLASGYKTVYQSTARATSMFPDRGRAFYKQRLRWSRNSYRTYLTAMWKGWLWHQPFICQLSVLQVMLTPVTMGFAVFYLFVWVGHPQPLVAVAAVGWLLAGRGCAASRTCARSPVTSGSCRSSRLRPSRSPCQSSCTRSPP